MSEFEDAIGWRGPGRLSFIVYGIWRRGGDEHLSTMEGAKAALVDLVPGSEVSCFVASDEGWPCDVGVFDIELEVWPEDLEAICRELPRAVCRHGSQLAWMMFDGVFNDVADIFCQDWATHIYAVQGNRESPDVDLAVADEVRHSAGWAKLVAEHRGRVSSIFPSLAARR